MSRSIILNDDAEVGTNLPDKFFAEQVFAGDYCHVIVERWSTDVADLFDAFNGSLSSARGDKQQTIYLMLGDAACLVSIYSGDLTARIAAPSASKAEDALARIKVNVPETQPGNAEVGISFWSWGPRGGTSNHRRLAVPTWEEIADNYSAPVRERLERLMDPKFRPAHGGQLVLLHGLPGSGKTFTLRALAWQWRSWCRVHYITDPDNFFGSQPNYMMQVSVHDDDPYGEIAETLEIEDPGKGWRLLLIEDASELLERDAREKTGQGLSRLLNLVDGLIGQGLRILVLVTTNEPLGKLHPAIARPGRCAAEIEFGRLTQEESLEWLVAHGLDGEVEAASYTLAELYAKLEGFDVESRIQPVGFSG